MESVIGEMRLAIEKRISHAFVLTGNVLDGWWPEGESDPIPFASALCRRWTENRGDRDRVLVRYCLSQGIRLYRGGELIPSSNDALAQSFSRLTGLEYMLSLPDRTAEDLLRQAAANPAEVIAPLYRFLRAPDSINTVLIEDLQYILPPGELRSHADRAVAEILLNWARDPYVSRGQGAIILLCPERARVHPDLLQGDDTFAHIDVSYPTSDERKEFLTTQGKCELVATRLANLTTGFRRLDLHRVVLQNESEDDIARHKAEIVSARCGDTVELIHADFGLKLSNAQPHVRDYLKGLSDKVLTNRADPTIPMGMLFVGVPGNGKSHLARAFAHDCGMNMLRLKNVRSMWVGESERNLERILDLLPSLAPTVVFIDEVDQLLAARGTRGVRGDGGSQVEARILGRLLDFMGNSDNRGDIIWIGATNRPDLLDIAAVRRFDRVFPFMNPGQEARAELVQDLVQRLAIPTASDWDPTQVAQAIGDMSCDEVEKILRRALEASTSGKVSLEDVKRARKALRHNYDPVMHELIALLSVAGSNYLCDLPWFDQEGALRSDVELPDFVQDIITRDKELDERKLSQRIGDLRRQLAGR